MGDPVQDHADDLRSVYPKESSSDATDILWANRKEKKGYTACLTL